MSAMTTEAQAVPASAVEEHNTPEVAAPAPAAAASHVETKVEEPAVAATAAPEAPKEVTKAEEPTGTAAEAPAPAAEEMKEEAKAAESSASPKRPKSPGLISKLLASFKGDKAKTPKAKPPKSPLKDKKAELPTPAVEETAQTAVPATTAPAVEVAPPATASEEVKAEEPAAVAAAPAVEAVKETETPQLAPEVMAADANKGTLVEEVSKKEGDVAAKAHKVSRRLSSRVGDLFNFKRQKSEVASPAKVDEHPPKIDEPATLAPLENPANEGAATVPAGAAVEPATVAATLAPAVEKPEVPATSEVAATA